MFESLVVWALSLTGVYLGVGGAAAILIHLRGLVRIDPATECAGWFFRVLVTPGIIALWPVLVFRWRQALHHGSTAGALESPATQEGLRRAHGGLIVVVASLSLAIAAAAIALRPAPAPVSRDADHVADILPPVGVRRDLGQIFPSVPARVLVARSLSAKHCLIFDFELNGPIPPTAFYWSPSPLANGHLPPDAIFLSMLWGPGRQWIPLPDPEMAAGGYLFAYSFKEHEVETAMAPKVVR